VVVAVVLIVSAEVAAVLPVTFTEAGDVHVGALTAPAGPAVTAQVKAIVPVNPSVGVAVIVDVPLLPAALIVTAVPESVKLGTVMTGVTTCNPTVWM
jgi:hypothetical protein